MRKILVIVGILLLVAGGLISAGVLSFNDTKEVLSIGDASISLTEKKTPDRTLGYVLLALGALGVVAGAVSRK